jgi:2-C-methyl-D-erythritol 4-phosphate cytidylyltransferase
MEQVYVVIVAGGSGTRMQTDVPKQFLALAGKPVFIHTIEIFLKAIPQVNIILVLPFPHIQMGEELLKAHQLIEKVSIVAGGETRFHSVKAGLHLTEDDGIVMVHDAVRCLVSGSLIQQCMKACLQHGSSIPLISCKDSMRMKNAETYNAVNRELFFSVQTPQSFKAKMLKNAFEQPYQPSFTDEASVAEQIGATLHFMEGEEANIKITRPVDLIFAAHYLKHK